MDLHNKQQYQVLLVEDQQDYARQLEKTLQDQYKIMKASNKIEALAITETFEPDVVLLDIGLPSIKGQVPDERTGPWLLEEFLKKNPARQIIMLTATYENETRIAVECLKKGAVDYILKSETPIDMIPSIVKTALLKRRSRKEEPARLFLVGNNNFENNPNASNSLTIIYFPGNRAARLSVTDIPAGPFLTVLKKIEKIFEYGSIIEKLDDLASLFSLLIGEEFKAVFDNPSEYMKLELSPNLCDIPWELFMHKPTQKFLGMEKIIGRSLPWATSINTTARSRHEETGVLIIADTDFDSPLPDAREEGIHLHNELHRLAKERSIEMDVNLLTGKKGGGDEAHFVNFAAGVRNKKIDIMHFAGHGVFHPNDPSATGIMLSDGLIPASILETLFLENDPPILVFANACEAGKIRGENPPWYYQRHVWGLAESCLRAGVKVYIGPMWPVFDNHGRKLAHLFYQHFFAGETAGKALLKAKKAIYEETRGESIAWATHVLYGDPTVRLFETI